MAAPGSHEVTMADMYASPKKSAARSVRVHAAAMTASGQLLRTKKANIAPEPEQMPQQITPTNGTNPLLQHGHLISNFDNDTWNDSQLIASVDNKNVSNKEVLMALGGGTGASIGGTGVLEMDQDLVRRMRYQDKAVMLLLLFMYFVTLGFSASFSYKQALNNSPVTFYADPRYHDMVTEGHDQDVFLQNFTGAPKDVRLQITGFVPVSSGVIGSIEWQGEYYYDAFSFALDLSPWVVREGSTDGSVPGPWSDNIPLVDGVVADDLENVNYYITQNRNDLAVLDFQKEVAWPSWEELATNIKHRIRQQGFPGIVSIHKTDCDNVSIYKNTAWANFMHSRTTKVLCALSVLGWVFYLPYMWLRCTSTTVRSRYKVDIPISDYWQLISDKLTADGFVEDPTAVGENFRQWQVTTGQLTVYGGRPIPRAAHEHDDQEVSGGEGDWRSDSS